MRSGALRIGAVCGIEIGVDVSWFEVARDVAGGGNHVVAVVDELEIALADGQRSPATVVAADPATDLAVVRSERRDLPPAQFADDLPEVGELTMATGNPLGFEVAAAGADDGVDDELPGMHPASSPPRSPIGRAPRAE